MWNIQAKIKVFRRKNSNNFVRNAREKNLPNHCFGISIRVARKNGGKSIQGLDGAKAVSLAIARLLTHNSDRKSVVLLSVKSEKSEKWHFPYHNFPFSIPLNHILCKYHYCIIRPDVRPSLSLFQSSFSLISSVMWIARKRFPSLDRQKFQNGFHSQVGKNI